MEAVMRRRGGSFFLRCLCGLAAQETAQAALQKPTHPAPSGSPAPDGAVINRRSIVRCSLFEGGLPFGHFDTIFATQKSLNDLQTGG